MKRRPKLVTPWRSTFRFWTQKLNGFAMLAIPVWLQAPEADRQRMLASIGLDSPALFIWLMFALNFILRNLKQPDPPAGPPGQ